MASKSLDSITPSDIESLGITRQDSASLHQLLKEIVAIHCGGTPATWQNITKRLLTPLLPFSFHQMLYYGCYKNYGHDPPAWVPDPANAILTNVGQLLDRRGKEFLGSAYKDPITSFSDFQKFSVSNPEVYWRTVLDEIDVSFSVPPKCMLQEFTYGESQLTYPGGQWLPEASINPAKNCLTINSRRSLDDSNNLA